jgi:hypothetical protein
MKTISKNILWPKKFSGKFIDWWQPLKPNTTQNSKINFSQISSDKFSLWSSRKKALSFLPLNKDYQIDVSVLEKFIREVPQGEITYRGFISSHLQQNLDGRSAEKVKKLLAIKKMISLVNSTVSDIKMIELNQICHNKG